MDANKADRWWSTIPETADALGVNVKTVRRMVRDDELPTVRIGRRQVVRNSVIEALRDGQAVG